MPALNPPAGPSASAEAGHTAATAAPAATANPSSPAPAPGPRSAARRGTRRAGLRLREREAALTLGLLVLLSLSFALWPTLDLLVSAAFHRPGQGFAGQEWPVALAVYRVVPVLGWTAALAGGLVALMQSAGPRALGVRWWRRSMVLALSLLLGVAGLVNGVFKEHWGRARPVAVQAFGGDRVFSPPGVPVDQCSRNCSFVSGHAATGFALGAIGLLGSAATRRRWSRIGWAAGLLVGLGRISQGGHFLSDVLYAGLAMQACGCVLRLAWLHVRVARRRHRRRRDGGTPGWTGPVADRP